MPGRPDVAVDPTHPRPHQPWESTAGDLLDLARDVRDGVEATFGVRLVTEPVLVGPLTQIVRPPERGASAGGSSDQNHHQGEQQQDAEHHQHGADDAADPTEGCLVPA